MIKACLIEKKIHLWQVFADALISRDRDTLINILDENGVFTIQDENLDTPEVSKDIFLQWIITERQKIEILTYSFDRCTFCKIGNMVVIFNEGLFPKKPKDSSEKVKTGLMFVIEKEKINQIDFCYSFLETENCYVFERKIEERIQKYMKKKCCSKDVAKKEFKRNPMSFNNL